MPTFSKARCVTCRREFHWRCTSGECPRCYVERRVKDAATAGPISDSAATGTAGGNVDAKRHAGANGSRAAATAGGSGNPRRGGTRREATSRG